MYGFAGDQVEVRGYIELRTTFTDGLASRTEKIRYLVVNAPSAYNILLGRPTLNKTGAVPSTRHMKVKLPSMEGLIITICSDQKEAKLRNCITPKQETINAIKVLQEMMTILEKHDYDKNLYGFKKEKTQTHDRHN